MSKLKAAPKPIRVEGKRIAADLLARLDEGHRVKLLQQMANIDPSMTRELQARLYEFEDLRGLEPREFQLLWKAIPEQRWLVALRGVSAEFLKFILSNLSVRAGESLQEELGASPPRKQVDIEHARQEVMGVAQRLQGEGALTLRKPSSDK